MFGGHLYSNSGVFLRELVQNGVDAIVEQRRAEPTFVGRVRVHTDETAGIVEVADDGVGLDEARIDLCLAKIGYSSKVKDDDLLGRFGIGLLSGFLVARELIVETLVAGGTPLRWRATPDGIHSTERGARTTRGTTVRLVLADQHRQYARPTVVRELLDRYVKYLAFEVEHEGTTVTVSAPWLANDPAAAIQAMLADHHSEPLAVFALPRGASARGCLWLTSERAPDEGGRVDVYLRGMLLERGARKLLPKWASFITGVVEAPALAPTASRETFVDDGAAVELANDLHAALLLGLQTLGVRELASVLAAHYLPLRGACVDSPALLDAIGDRLPVHSNVGLVDIPTLLASQSDRVIRYVQTQQDFAHTSPLANAHGIALVDASYIHDVPFLQAYAEHKHLKLVALSVDELELMIQPAPDLVPQFTRVLAAAREALEGFGVSPELGRFEPSAMPAFLMSDALATQERAGELAQNTGSSLVRSLMSGLAAAKPVRGTRFVLNVHNKLVAALPTIVDEARIRRVVRLLYAQSSMTLRRSLSIAQTRAFSDDLLALLEDNVQTAAGLN